MDACHAYEEGRPEGLRHSGRTDTALRSAQLTSLDERLHRPAVCPVISAVEIRDRGTGAARMPTPGRRTASRQQEARVAGARYASARRLLLMRPPLQPSYTAAPARRTPNVLPRAKLLQKDRGRVIAARSCIVRARDIAVTGTLVTVTPKVLDVRPRLRECWVAWAVAARAWVRATNRGGCMRVADLEQARYCCGSPSRVCHWLSEPRPQRRRHLPQRRPLPVSRPSQHPRRRDAVGPAPAPTIAPQSATLPEPSTEPEETTEEAAATAAEAEQVAPPVVSAPAGEGEPMIVTGSRIKRTSFASAAPVEVIDRRQLEFSGAQNLAQVVQYLTVAQALTSAVRTKARGARRRSTCAGSARRPR